jgi:hypothetical protein
MARPKRAAVGVTFYDRQAADRAAAILQGKRLAVEVVEVQSLLCPGGIRKQGWVVQVLVGEMRLAERYLKEAGSGS